MSSKLKHNFVAKSLPEFYLKEDLADVHFAFQVDGVTVKVSAHKFVLASSSAVFRAMFYGPLKEKDVVEIGDADDSAFKEFLQFFYLQEITLSMENIDAVVRLADKYDMMDNLNSCVSFLEKELTEENMIWGLQLAVSLNNQKLKRFCQRKIQYLTSEYFNDDIFLQCDRKVLKNILEVEAFCCSDDKLFEACIAWAKTTCAANDLDGNVAENLKNQLGECFHLIRFGAMKDKEIGMIMSNKLYKGLFTNEELTDIICTRSIQGFESAIFRNMTRSQLFEWDNRSVLTYKRRTFLVKKNKFPVPDSTWFSTNTPLLLGGLQVFFGLAFRYPTKVNFNMRIIKYQDQTMASKVLCTETIECDWMKPTSLQRPIMIEAQKMYEIRLENPSRKDVYCKFGLRFNSSHRETIRDMDKDVKVEFHENPITYERNGGSVLTLKFNKILREK